MSHERDRPRHPIQVAARRAGLSAALLRAWERRYAAVSPHRDASGQRLYSDADVERLRRLRMVTEVGRRIGEMASLDDEALAAVLREDAREELRPAPPGAPGRPSFNQLVEEALRRVRRGDAKGLHRLLDRTFLLYEPLLVIDDLLGTLMERIGRCWVEGELDAADEHLACQVVRPLLDDLLLRLEPDDPTGSAVVAVPAGETHELGALGAAVALESCGWSALNLGGSLPARSIAHVARERRVDLVALSVTWSGELRQVEQEMRALREQLPDRPLLVGGYAGDQARRLLASLGAIHVRKVQQLPGILARIRREPRSPHGSEPPPSGGLSRRAEG